MMYCYYDHVAGRAISSAVPLQSNGLTRVVALGDLPTPDNSANSEAMARDDVTLLIGKRQRMQLGADHDRMWRFYNNVQVAEAILNGTASADIQDAFADMLAANQRKNPQKYGEMTVAAFADYLIKRYNGFQLLGLRLETEMLNGQMPDCC